MTPQGMLGQGTGSTTSGSDPSLYNQFSSAGDAGRGFNSETEQQPQGESLVDKATKRFGGVFDMFVQLTESYPGADKEAQIVKDAMAGWLNTIANRINEQGGSSNY
jgi:hypothetical protein